MQKIFRSAAMAASLAMLTMALVLPTASYADGGRRDGRVSQAPVSPSAQLVA